MPKQILVFLAVAIAVSVSIAANHAVAAQPPSSRAREPRQLPNSINRLEFVSTDPGVAEIPSPKLETLPSQLAVPDGDPVLEPLEGELAPEAVLDSGFLPGGTIVDAFGMPIGDAVPGEHTPEVYSTNKWFRGGNWYSYQEFTMMLRTNLPKVHIAVDTSSNPELSVQPRTFFRSLPELDAKSVDFTYEPGTRLTLGKNLGRDRSNRDHSAEFSFLGLFEYSSSATIAAANPDAVFVQDPNVPIILPTGVTTLLGSVETDSDTFVGALGYLRIVDVPGFSHADRQAVLHEADLNSFEWNYRVSGRAMRDRLVLQPDGRWIRFGTPSHVSSIFAGLRYVRIDEFFQYRSEGGDPAFGLEQDRGLYEVATGNNLFGIQLGGDFAEKYTDWTWGARAKIGGLVNLADRLSSLDTLSRNRTTGQLDAASRREDIDDDSLAVLAEAGIVGTYYLRPNTAIRASYDFMFINGVATVTKNIGLAGDSFPVFRLTNNAFYHGLSLGFEMTW